ncbi:MAG: hypothetical protein AAB584_01280 [Patescibacteria group bacterium]
MTVTATLVRTAVLVPEEPELDLAEAQRILPRRIEEAREAAERNHATTVMPTLYSEALRLQAVSSLERRASGVLKELDIEPFTPESVNAYVEAKLAEKLPENQKLRRKTRTVSTLGWLCGAMLVVSILTILANDSGGFFTVTVAVAGFIGGLVAMATTTGIGKWKWRRVEIERYNAKIPEYVLRKAIQVKQALPEGKLWIYALSPHSIENPLFRGDPFLELQAGKKRFFLEVWDEREFEEQEHSRQQEVERQELATAQE